MEFDLWWSSTIDDGNDDSVGSDGRDSVALDFAWNGVVNIFHTSFMRNDCVMAWILRRLSCVSSPLKRIRRKRNEFFE